MAPINTWNCQESQLLHENVDKVTVSQNVLVLFQRKESITQFTHLLYSLHVPRQAAG